jgi:hypothetical protein
MLRPIVHPKRPVFVVTGFSADSSSPAASPLSRISVEPASARYSMPHVRPIFHKDPATFRPTDRGRGPTVRVGLVRADVRVEPPSRARRVMRRLGRFFGKWIGRRSQNFPELPTSAISPIDGSRRSGSSPAGSISPEGVSFSRRRLPPWFVNRGRRVATPAKRGRCFPVGHGFASRRRVVAKRTQSKPSENLVWARLAGKCIAAEHTRVTKRSQREGERGSGSSPGGSDTGVGARGAPCSGVDQVDTG